MTNKRQLARWSPTEKQRAYLIHLLDSYASGADTTDRTLAERINVHHTTISHWRDSPEFEVWIREAFDKFLSGGLKRVLVRALNLALRGSVKHMEFFAKYSGQAPDPMASADDTRNYSFNILVPRPPELPPAGGGA